MKFLVQNLLVKQVDTVIVALFKEEKLSENTKKHLGKKMLTAFEARLKTKDFEAEEGQKLVLFEDDKTFVFLGRGEEKEQSPNAAEQIGGMCSKLMKGKKNIAILVNRAEDIEAFAYGISLGLYEFSRYKSKVTKPSVQNIYLLHENEKKYKDFGKKIEIFAESANLLRDMTNTPTGQMNTMDLAKAAKSVAKSNGLKITVLDEKKLRKISCGGLVGVGQGAEFGPCMVILEYRYKTKSKNPHLAFLGKGIVFDTGGLNIKPTGFIETMKEDMAGAATVIASMQAIAKHKIPGYFIGVLACAENAVSDKSMHPGDVLKAYNGISIEVTNTDAEGRLVLADGLAYIEKNYKPKGIVDIATLTGAVTVALGYDITGVLGNDQKFIDLVMKAAKTSKERMWQLPLEKDHIKATKGSFTDIKNSTDNVRAGTIMGAAFLDHFVKNTPWAHLDIGGTAWADKPTQTTSYGATAVALRTFIELAERSGENA